MLIGLVGKPSVGKSTFFKAATLAEIEIASYPFTTIKANHGVGYVKVDCIDKEFKVQCMPNHGFCVDGTGFCNQRLPPKPKLNILIFPFVSFSVSRGHFKTLSHCVSPSLLKT